MSCAKTTVKGFDCKCEGYRLVGMQLKCQSCGYLIGDYVFTAEEMETAKKNLANYLFCNAPGDPIGRIYVEEDWLPIAAELLRGRE